MTTNATTNAPHYTRSQQQYVEGSNATDLNTVDVWTSGTTPSTRGNGKIWIVYIHGGAWRDPEVDSGSFEPAVSALSKSSSKSSIAGFASINYRLSPNPTHPRNPSNQGDLSRNVHYPTHLLDVAHALLYLDKKYDIANRYMLLGHSAGGTLSFELNNWYLPDTPLPQPNCVLGVSGIYHFEPFLEVHKDTPAYKEFMEGAFPDRSLWKQADPCISQLPGLAIWEKAKMVILAHSDDDESVENAQAAFMLERIKKIPDSKERAHFLKATGKHDEIWQSGDILAGLISKSLDLVHTSSSLNVSN